MASSCGKGNVNNKDWGCSCDDVMRYCMRGGFMFGFFFQAEDGIRDRDG